MKIIKVTRGVYDEITTLGDSGNNRDCGDSRDFFAVHAD